MLNIQILGHLLANAVPQKKWIYNDIYIYLNTYIIITIALYRMLWNALDTGGAHIPTSLVVDIA